MNDIVLKVITKWLTDAYKGAASLWFYETHSGYTYIGDGYHFYRLPAIWIPYDFTMLQHACPHVRKLTGVELFHDVERDNTEHAEPTGVTLDAPPKNKLTEFATEHTKVYVDQLFLKEFAYDKNRISCNVSVHPENGEKKPVMFDFGDWQVVILPVRRGGQG